MHWGHSCAPEWVPCQILLLAQWMRQLPQALDQQQGAGEQMDRVVALDSQSLAGVDQLDQEWGPAIWNPAAAFVTATAPGTVAAARCGGNLQGPSGPPCPGGFWVWAAYRQPAAAAAAAGAARSRTPACLAWSPTSSCWQAAGWRSHPEQSCWMGHLASCHHAAESSGVGHPDVAVVGRHFEMQWEERPQRWADQQVVCC